MRPGSASRDSPPLSPPRCTAAGVGSALGCCTDGPQRPYEPFAAILSHRRPIPSGASDVIDPDGERAAVQAALHEFLSQAAREHPLLFVIEDLHWASSATRDAVAHLARVGGDAQLMLLVTTRDEELGLEALERSSVASRHCPRSRSWHSRASTRPPRRRSSRLSAVISIPSTPSGRRAGIRCSSASWHATGRQSIAPRARRGSVRPVLLVRSRRARRGDRRRRTDRRGARRVDARAFRRRRARHARASGGGRPDRSWSTAGPLRLHARHVPLGALRLAHDQSQDAAPRCRRPRPRPSVY